MRKKTQALLASSSSPPLSTGSRPNKPQCKLHRQQEFTVSILVASRLFLVSVPEWKLNEVFSFLPITLHIVGTSVCTSEKFVAPFFVIILKGLKITLAGHERR